MSRAQILSRIYKGQLNPRGAGGYLEPPFGFQAISHEPIEFT